MLKALWLKGWLEMRSWLMFAVLWSVGFLLLFAQVGSRGPDPEGRWQEVILGVTSLVWAFIPCWLAGTGVKTQPGFGPSATKGLHGSTHFTLSLPVSRARLFVARTMFGLMVLTVTVVVLFGAIWIMHPAIKEGASMIDALVHLLVVLAISFALYGLAALVASLVDEKLVVPVGTVVIVVLWVAGFTGKLPGAVDAFGPLVAGSPLLTHAVPWSALAVALVAGSVSLIAALRVLERQEF